MVPRTDCDEEQEAVGNFCVLIEEKQFRENAGQVTLKYSMGGMLSQTIPTDPSTKPWLHFDLTPFPGTGMPAVNSRLVPPTRRNSLAHIHDSRLTKSGERMLSRSAEFSLGPSLTTGSSRPTASP